MEYELTGFGVTGKQETSVLYLVPAAYLHKETEVLYICFEKNTIP